MKVFRIELKDHYQFLGEDGKNPFVDVYLPYNLAEMKREDDMRPSMIVCPGGGYAFCSEREEEPIALKLLDLGFNVFVLNYSVAPHRYPSQILEVAALFDFIFKHSKEYHGDITKTGIIGFSAGGHLAAHYSNLWNSEMICKYFENANKPALSVLCYPVITTEYPHKYSFENLVGHFPLDDYEKELFSCDKLVGEQTPPTFVFHTFSDNMVPVENSICYAKALSDHKIPFEMHIYPFCQHGISTADNLTLNELDDKIGYVSDWINILKKWLNYMLIS